MATICATAARPPVIRLAFAPARRNVWKSKLRFAANRRTNDSGCALRPAIAAFAGQLTAFRERGDRDPVVLAATDKRDAKWRQSDGDAGRAAGRRTRWRRVPVMITLARAPAGVSGSSSLSAHTSWSLSSPSMSATISLNVYPLLGGSGASGPKRFSYSLHKIDQYRSRFWLARGRNRRPGSLENSGGVFGSTTEIMPKIAMRLPR